MEFMVTSCQRFPEDDIEDGLDTSFALQKCMGIIPATEWLR